MWGDGHSAGFGGGGFVAGSTDSPGGDKQGKGRRSQNIIPVCVKQLLECQEDSFKLEGFEAHTVSLVGLVREVETTTTKMSMYIEDQTGTIECINYVGTDGDTSAAPTVICEGTYGKIVGALRTMKGQKYVLIFKSEAVTDLNELTCHLLEVIHAGMKLKKLRAAEDSKPAVDAALDNTFSNSMIKGGLGGGTAAGGAGNPAGGGVRGFTANQNLVHRVIATARDEAGMHKDQIIAACKTQISPNAIEAILEFLSNEGHVFSTVDEDHFKTTDSNFL